jgi:uncharacterized protein (DUF1697 family)
MPRYVAFLRAINVGGRVVKMDALRTLVADAGFSRVETFIASGNVIFDSQSRHTGRIEERIEAALADALGYRVATFVRPVHDVIDVAQRQAFPQQGNPGTALYIGFLKSKPRKAAERALLALAGEINQFRVHRREVYWLSRGRYGGIGMRGFSGADLEKVMGGEATLRNATTIRKLATIVGHGDASDLDS